MELKQYLSVFWAFTSVVKYLNTRNIKYNLNTYYLMTSI